jgi:hypothetical protein
MKVIAYQVTARRATDPRGFRRCGRWFPVGQPVRVALADLTPDQAAYLKDSNPRDLIVVEELEKVAPAPVVTAIVTGPVDEPALKAAVAELAAEGGAIVLDNAPASPPAKKGRGK